MASSTSGPRSFERVSEAPKGVRDLSNLYIKTEQNEYKLLATLPDDEFIPVIRKCIKVVVEDEKDTIWSPFERVEVLQLIFTIQRADKLELYKEGKPPRSVSIQGDVINSTIITGDDNEQ